MNYTGQTLDDCGYNVVNFDYVKITVANGEWGGKAIICTDSRNADRILEWEWESGAHHDLIFDDSDPLQEPGVYELYGWMGYHTDYPGYECHPVFVVEKWDVLFQQKYIRIEHRRYNQAHVEVIYTDQGVYAIVPDLLNPAKIPKFITQIHDDSDNAWVEIKGMIGDENESAD